MVNEQQPEIYKVLGIDEAKSAAVQNPIPTPGEPVAPFALPIVDFAAEAQKSLGDHVTDNILKRSVASVAVEKPSLPFKESNARFAKPSSGLVRKLRNILIYPVIFVISFAFFYVMFNFSSLVGQVNALFVGNEDEVILQDDLVPFYKWMNGYYFAVSNKELLEPNNDIDRDGLSNLDEYLVRTNPTLVDSDSDGFSDGIEIINSTNPWGRGEMTDAQENLIDKLDMIKINNRISFNTISPSSRLQVEESINFNTAINGMLSIPKLNMQVPVVWSQDPANFDHDLTKGVVHYPGTSMPGEQGTVYISGHSSDYFWKNHPYKQIFARINALEPGDDIFVDATGADGKIYNFRYKVTAEQIFAPNDQAQFIDNSAAKLNLSTCWPIGTQRDRYVVSAVLSPL